jgi:hypothetical protein
LVGRRGPLYLHAAGDGGAGLRDAMKVSTDPLAYAIGVGLAIDLMHHRSDGMSWDEAAFAAETALAIIVAAMVVDGTGGPDRAKSVAEIIQAIACGATDRAAAMVSTRVYH